MSRVQTQDSVLANLAPQKAASAPAEDQKSDAETKDEGETKPKKTAQERIQDLANKRKEAEAEATAAKRENAELKAQLQALSASAKPLESQAKPLRSQFATDDEYIESLSDWKAREAIAKREQEQAQARIEAEQAEIAQQWSKRQEQAIKALPDYAEVLGKSEVAIPAHIHQVILESEFGPQIAYFLAMNPDEAKHIAQLKPLAAVKRIAALERDLSEIEDDEKPPVKKDKDDPAKPQKSKAPPPIDAVKSTPGTGESSSSDYEEYKRRRQAGK
jgi:hypothetical protein